MASPIADPIARPDGPAAVPADDAVRRVADAVRRRVLAHTLAENGGYLSQACSAADILATLYLRVLRIGPSAGPLVPLPFAGAPGAGRPTLTGAAYNGPRGPEFDRFIFSPVHYALVLYATLIETGRLHPEALRQFNRDGTTLELIGAEHSPGHEVTAGSLAQALSQAAGIAQARRLCGEPGRVVVFMSDGEFQEGQTFEAFAALAYHGLTNVLVYVDVNGQQCDGPMASVMTIDPLGARLGAFGADVVEVDGHDVPALAAAGGPSAGPGARVVLCRTDPCRGLDLLRERAPRLHYVRFRSPAERAAYAAALARFPAPADASPAPLEAQPAAAAPPRPAGAPAPPASPPPGVAVLAPPYASVLRPHAQNLVRFAASHPELVVLSADLTASCEADLFRDTYPQRFFSLGMAEQNLMSWAGGLAREGLRPYLHTFAVFLTRRTYDQLAMSVAYPNLPVRLVGFLPGITTPGGVTHQAIDDVALMRALPNLTVVECADATEVESVLAAVHELPGPVYLRMLRGEVPRLFPPSAPFELGVLRPLGTGNDVLLVSSGICTEEALRAAAALRAAGVSLTHLHAATLKPFDDPQLLDAAAQTRHGVVTLENHTVVGGLGSAVAERLAEAGIGRRLVRLGLADRFAHGASRGYLLREYGLDARAVVDAVGALLGTAPAVPAAALGPDAAPAAPATPGARPEAL